MNTSIKKLDKKDYNIFTKMFCDYFMDDLKHELKREFIIDKIINTQIFTSYENSIIFIDLVYSDDKAKGFIIYQIDSDKSDWNERPGYGFIREFYIIPQDRKKGLGSMLLKHAENNLKYLGVEKVYLTSDGQDYVKEFYINNNYINENKINNYNKNEYFTKKL